MKLISNILGSIAGYSANNPRKVIVLSIFITLSALLLASTIKISMRFQDVLPKDMAAIEEYKEGVRDFGRGQFIVVMIESPEGVRVSRYRGFIKRYKRELIASLGVGEAKKSISEKKLKRMVAYIGDHLMMLVDESDLVKANERLSPEAIRDSMSGYGFMQTSFMASKVFDPLGLIELVQGIFMPPGAFSPDISGNFFITEDNSTAFFIIGTTKSAGDTEYTDELVANAKEIETDLKKRFGYSELSEKKRDLPPRVTLVGSHMIIRDDRKDLVETIYSTIAFSLIGIALLFFLFFMRGRTLFFAYIPMLIGVIWSFACAKFFVGSLNIITVSIGAIIIGLGIDFPAHLLNDYYKKREDGTEFLDALVDTWKGVGRSVFYGMLTTSAAFFAMLASSLEVFRDLGIIAGIGLMVTFLAVIVILPALLSLWGDDFKGGSVRKYPNTLSGIPIGHAQKVLLICVLLFAFFGFFVNQLKLTSSVRMVAETVHSDRSDSIDSFKRFSKHLGVFPIPILFISRGVDEESALESNDELMSLLKRYQRDGRIGYVDTLSNWLPSEKREKKLREMLAGFDNLAPEIFKKNYTEAISDISGKWMTMHSAYGKAVERFLGSRSQASREEMIRYGMTKTISDYMKKTPDGYRIATYVYLPSGVDYIGSKEKLIDDLKGEEIFESGSVINPSEESVIESVQQVIWDEVIVIALAMLIAILFIVWICFRSITFAVISLIPMIVGGVAVLGSYALLFDSISSINLLWFPIYMGLSIDDAIHLGNNLKLSGGDLRVALNGCGGAIALTSFTTMIAFGSFLLSPIPLLQQAGLFISLAMAWELLASLIFLPSIIRIASINKIFK